MRIGPGGASDDPAIPAGPTPIAAAHVVQRLARERTRLARALGQHGLEPGLVGSELRGSARCTGASIATTASAVAVLRSP